MPNFNEWIQFLLDEINKSKSKKLILRLYNNKKYQYFTQEGRSIAVEDAIQHKSVKSALEDRHITSWLALGGFAREVFLGYLNKLMNIIKKPDNYKLLDDTLNMLKNEENITNSAFLRPEQIIIPLLLPFKFSHISDITSQYKDLITNFLLTLFHDPRFPENKLAWRNVRPDLKQIFIKWLLASDLNLFFHIIEQTSDFRWRERREFWFKYLEKGYIDQTWPVLGVDAAFYANKSKQNSSFATLSGGSRNQSVLLIKIKQLIIAEWSHNGACRIWFDKAPVAPVFFKTNYRRDHLMIDPIEWIPHITRWQEKVSKTIYSYTNININL
jgi:hypothetical protein